MGDQKRTACNDVVIAMVIYALAALFSDYTFFVVMPNASSEHYLSAVELRYLALAATAFQAFIAVLAIRTMHTDCDAAMGILLVFAEMYFVPASIILIAIYYQYLASLGELAAEVANSFAYFVVVHASPTLAVAFAALAAAVPALRRGDSGAVPLAVLFAFLAAALAIVSLI